MTKALLTRTLTVLDALPSDPSQFVDADALNAWPGWGALAPALETDASGSWAEISDLLVDRLGDQGIEAGRQVCHTSFYTPEWLTREVFDLLADLGITSGRLLDLGTGTGRFLDAAGSGFTLVGIEKEPLSARIARLRHPQAAILAGDLAKAHLADNTFDVVVGNIPFSTSTAWASDWKYHGTVTGMFLAATAHVLTETGVAVLITPPGVIDAWHRYGDARLSVLGAVRLASKTFEGTNTSADVVVLTKSAHHLDVVRGMTADRTDGLSIDALWENRPEWVAGQIEATGAYQMPMRVASADPQADAMSALGNLRTYLRGLDLITTSDDDPLADVVTHSADGEPVGAFVERDGDLFTVDPEGNLAAVRATKELRALIALRDLVVRLMEAEGDRSTPPEIIEPLRTETRETWERYVATYGPLNRGTMHEGAIDAETGLPKMSWRRPSMGGFRRDPHAVQIMAIEHYDMETGEASAAPLLLHRINVEPKRPTSANSLGQAVSISVAEFGHVDFERIGELLDLEAQTARERCEAEGLTFLDPATDRVLTRRDYLAGHIPSKITAARRAGLTRNVEALEAIQPAPLEATDIDVRIGISWIPAADMTAFAHEVLGANGRLDKDAMFGQWDASSLFGVSNEARATYGTDDMNALKIFEYALNSRTPVIYDEVYIPAEARYKKVRNASATLAALDRLNALDDAFRAWIWSNEERRERLLAIYNTTFGGIVARQHDGSHLTLEGMSPDVTPWKHQLDMVDFATSVPRALCAHAVGAGKTITAIATAMTMRQFGMANRPLVIVPGHLLEQVARECQQTYPNASILLATREDLSGDARRLFAARCVSMDPDLIVMSHESFTSLPLSVLVEDRLASDMKFHLAQRANRSGQTRTSAKRYAKALESADARVEKLRHGVTDRTTVCFDHLGVDYLIVDEAHMFRRHPAATTRTEGFSMGASQRATDLSLKLDYLAMTYGAERPHALMMTGTPFVNSLAETFVWLTYLMPQRLANMDISTFDAFAATFVEYVTRAEVAPDGSGFKITTRPAAVTNAPELMGMFDEVAHFVSHDDLNLPRPKVTYHEVISKRTLTQIRLMDEIVERSAKLSQGQGAEGDNILVVCSDGRKVALDPTLVLGRMAASPKVTKAAKTIVKVERENPGCFQLVCLDQGTPKPDDAATYGRLRSALVNQGVDPTRIRFVHEATTDKQRAALFAACRNGEVSVLMGSTSKVGTGTNIQRRLKALHHIDPAWNPAGMEQRDGRGVRYGNTYDSVDIYRHITEGTFDAFMWQTLVRKATFVSALLSNANAGQRSRRVEDIGDIVLDYSNVLAAASGNALLGQRAEVAANVRRLRTLAAMHAGRVATLTTEADRLKSQAATCDDILKGIDALDEGLTNDPDRTKHLDTLAETTARAIRNDSISLRWGGVTEYWYSVRSHSEGSIMLCAGDSRYGVQCSIPTRTWRRGSVDALTGVLRSALNEVADSIDLYRSTTIERRDEAMRESDDLRSTIAAMTFERQDEFDKAVSTLARIDREIALSADEQAA